MRVFGWVVALAIALGVEVAIKRLVPEVDRYVDVMTLPIAWYALARSQRSAMLVGCAGGLVQDAWFQAGLFGIQGFCKTLMGWFLGGLGARFELNVFWARALSGALLPVVGPLLELGVRRLFDQEVLVPRAIDLVLRAAAGGLLVPVMFAIVEKVVGRDRSPRTARKRV